MLFSTLLLLVGVASSASAAALQLPRQAQSTGAGLACNCPVTLASYVTVTVTGAPPTVTIVLPDYTSIASSLSYASAIDSIVVVEQSQDRPVSAPVDTAIPTFVHTIVAPAFEATEASTGNNTSVYYVSAGKNNNSPSQSLTSDVVVGLTTVSIVPQTVSAFEPQPTTTVISTIHKTSTVRGPFANSTNGWNSTAPGSTGIDALGTTNASASPTSFSTTTTYIVTKTVTASASITLSPTTDSYPGDGYGYIDSSQTWIPGQTVIEKRQTCVLVSAAFAGVWGTWCNSWDGHTTMPYTSWETTIDPGTSLRVGTSIPAQATPQVPDAQPSKQVQPSGSAASNSPPCGEMGPFSITFDNLPAQSASNDSAGLPPIFNPFDHFYWSDSWSYVPPPPTPYAPQSGSQLAISSPLTQNDSTGSITGFEIPDGGFGAGPRDHIDAYWFNAHWAFVGCQANISDPSGTCDFEAQGYRYDTAAGQSRLHVTQHFSQPLCEAEHCGLQRIEFNDMFNTLTTLVFHAKIGNQFRVLYADTLGLGWWNNTCEAGMLRASSRK